MTGGRWCGSRNRRRCGFRCRWPTARPAAACARRRWGPGPSVYLSSWFNTLRTSYGMALYARRTGNAELLEAGAPDGRAGAQGPGPRRRVQVHCRARGRREVDGLGRGRRLRREHEGRVPGLRHVLDRLLAAAVARGGAARRRRDPAALPATGPLHDRPAGRRRHACPRDSPRTDPSQEETLPHGQGGDRPGGALSPGTVRPGPRSGSTWKRPGRGWTSWRGRSFPMRQWYDYETFWSCSPREAGIRRAHPAVAGQQPGAWRRPWRPIWRPTGSPARRATWPPGKRCWTICSSTSSAGPIPGWRT